MSSSRSPARVPANNTMPAKPGVFPKVALQALEPFPGGVWTITEQNDDGVKLAYSMSADSQAFSFTMRSCMTKEDVEKHCQRHLYQPSRSQTTTGATPDPRSYLHAVTELPPQNDLVQFAPGNSYRLDARDQAPAATSPSHDVAVSSFGPSSVFGPSGSQFAAQVDSPFVKAESSPSEMMPQPNGVPDLAMFDASGYHNGDFMWGFENEVISAMESPFAPHDFKHAIESGAQHFQELEHHFEPSNMEEGWNFQDPSESWESLVTFKQ